MNDQTNAARGRCDCVKRTPNLPLIGIFRLEIRAQLGPAASSWDVKSDPLPDLVHGLIECPGFPVTPTPLDDLYTLRRLVATPGSSSRPMIYQLAERVVTAVFGGLKIVANEPDEANNYGRGSAAAPMLDYTRHALNVMRALSAGDGYVLEEMVTFLDEYRSDVMRGTGRAVRYATSPSTLAALLTCEWVFWLSERRASVVPSPNDATLNPMNPDDSAIAASAEKYYQALIRVLSLEGGDYNAMKTFIRKKVIRSFVEPTNPAMKAAIAPLLDELRQRDSAPRTTRPMSDAP